MSLNTLIRLLSVAWFFVLRSRAFAVSDTVVDSSLLASDGPHHFLTRSHDYVLLALILTAIALLIINHFRIKSQRALRESEGRFKALAERSMVGICVVQDDVYKYVNPRLTEMLGRTETELVNKKGPTDFVHPDDRANLEGRLRRRIAGDEEFAHYESRAVTKAGEIRHLEVFGSRMIYHGRPAILGTLLDITERKRTDEALEKAHSDLRQILDSAAPLYMIDRDYNVLRVNQTFCAYVGKRAEEVTGKKCYEVWPGLLCNTPECPMQIILRGHERADYEREHTNAAGRTSILAATALPYRGIDESVQGMIASFGDITELKRRETALRQSEEKARAQFKSIPVPTYIWQWVDQDFVLIDYNDEAFEITRGGVDNLVGKVYAEVFPSHMDWREDMLRCLHQKTTVRWDRPMYHTLASTGDRRWLLITFAYVPPDLVMVHTADVTARTQAEEALKESEKKFRTLAETTNAAIIIYNKNGLIYANPATETITEYSKEEFAAGPPWDLALPEYREMLQERTSQRLSGDRSLRESYEIPIKTKTGKDKWIMISGAFIQYDGQPAVLGTALDVTERKRAEEALRLAHEERYDQVKQIAGGVAHEIYNALFPAVSTLDKLKERLGSGHDDKEGRNSNLVELAETSVERAIQMTEFVTQLSRLDSETGVEPLDLTEMFSDILRDKPRIAELGARVELNIDRGTQVSMNRTHAYSLFNNLVTNALDALEEVDDRILGIRAGKFGENIKIDVTDTGPGIRPEVVPKIFSPFFSTKPRTGTGLGLAICKRIVDIYGGKISVDSNLDRGTSFTILLKT
jgi:PAS domain S-box-containing protein